MSKPLRKWSGSGALPFACAALFADAVNLPKLSRELSGIPVYFNPDLKEIDFGDWEGLSFQEIAAADPEHVLKWARFKPDFSFPGGESITHFLDRVGRIAKCLTEMPEKEVSGLHARRNDQRAYLPFSRSRAL